MRTNLFDELKSSRREDREHLSKLAEELRSLLEAKKKRSWIDKLRPKKPRTEPKAWD